MAGGQTGAHASCVARSHQSLQHGYGTYVLAKGGKYEGEWDQGVRHGTGTYYYPDGARIYRGEWKQNVRFSARMSRALTHTWRQLKHGKGTFTYENGDKYDGEFLNGKQVRIHTPLQRPSILLTVRSL